MTAKKQASEKAPAKQPAKATPVQKTIEQGINEQVKQEPPTEQTPVEKVPENNVAANPQPGILKAKPDDDEQYILNGKPQFWNNKVHMPGTGIVHGKVTNGQKRIFFRLAPKNVNYSRFMGDVDLVQKRIDEAKAKMKRKIGLKD